MRFGRPDPHQQMEDNILFVNQMKLMITQVRPTWDGGRATMKPFQTLPAELLFPQFHIA